MAEYQNSATVLHLSYFLTACTKPKQHIEISYDDLFAAYTRWSTKANEKMLTVSRHTLWVMFGSNNYTVRQDSTGLYLCNYTLLSEKEWSVVRKQDSFDEFMRSQFRPYQGVDVDLNFIVTRFNQWLETTPIQQDDVEIVERFKNYKKGFHHELVNRDYRVEKRQGKWVLCNYAVIPKQEEMLVEIHVDIPKKHSKESLELIYIVSNPIQADHGLYKVSRYTGDADTLYLKYKPVIPDVIVYFCHQLPINRAPQLEELIKTTLKEYKYCKDITSEWYQCNLATLITTLLGVIA